MLRRGGSKTQTADAEPLLLFVYDARRGNTESTEKEKILGFYPTVVNIDEQLSTVGLAQTFALFSGTFSGDSSFITLDTDKRKWAVRNFETGVWIGLVVKNRFGPGKSGTGACKICLEDLYGHFTLLNGSIQRLLDIDATGRRARASLQAVVEIWGDLLTQKKKSDERSDYENPFSLKRFGVLPALHVPLPAYLALQAIAHELHRIDVGATVHRTLIIYDVYLLWSDLNSKNTRLLYNFAERSELLTEGKSNPRGVTMIYLSEEDTLTPYWLMALRKGQLTLFLLLNSDPQNALDFDALGPDIQTEAALLSQAATRQLNAINSFHLTGYRYASIDRSMHIGCATPAAKIKTLSQKSLYLLTKIQNRIDEQCLAAEDTGDSETIFKGENCGWIVIKKAGAKMLCIALDIVDDFTLEEVDDYVQRMCNRNFPGSFEV